MILFLVYFVKDSKYIYNYTIFTLKLRNISYVGVCTNSLTVTTDLYYNHMNYTLQLIFWN